MHSHILTHISALSHSYFNALMLNNKFKCKQVSLSVDELIIKRKDMSFFSFLDKSLSQELMKSKVPFARVDEKQNNQFRMIINQIP